MRRLLQVRWGRLPIQRIQPAQDQQRFMQVRLRQKPVIKRQKEKEKEREKLQKWDEEYKTNKKRQQQTQLYGKEYTDKMTGTSRSKEEEVLEKIRAIWLAETIKRQIQLDQEHKEVLQRRKLYQAFMQQKIQEDDVRKK